MEQTITNQLGFKDRCAYALQRMKGIPVETDLTPYIRILEQINAYDFTKYTDTSLAGIGKIVRDRALSGESPDNLLPETYALVREAMKRTLGMTLFDVQIIGGIALHQGKLIQMHTGEGKTLTIVCAGCLGGLTGKGVHIMTANDYLAERDSRWMGPVYEFLGLSVGCVKEKQGVGEKKDAYNADITYLTAKECGFDLLRDQLQYDPAAVVQREPHQVIVDEADFILIDEARIPLVIAGHSPEPDIDPVYINTIVRELVYEKEYLIDKAFRRIYLTIDGEKRVEQLLQCGGMHEQKNSHIFAAIHVGLHAYFLLHKDRDYILRNNRIELVDENTGRVVDKRRWPYGIQAALEAKEGVPVHPEGRIYGSITINNLIRLYPKISGLTATAVQSSREFAFCYGLATVIVPTNVPVQRIDAPDVVFATKKAKLTGIIREVKKVNATGRPILLGTGSVMESEELYTILVNEGVECQVLNAKNDHKEAELIARAGMRGAVTISTNMAGRGTDIKLGGENGEGKDEITALGGLYVIGTLCHENTRIEHQLRGRAGRQGDPGLSRFFISLEDDIIKRYSIFEFFPGEYLNSESLQPIEDNRVAREIARAQEIIDAQHYAMRRTLEKYAELCEKQRKYIGEIRKSILLDQYIPGDRGEQLREHYNVLAADVGREKVRALLRSLYLRHIDQFWADHLFYIDMIKEGIHLQHLAKQVPILVFIQQVSDAFSSGLEIMHNEVVDEFCQIRTLADTLSSPMVSSRKPSGLWTYLINDNPFPDFKVALMGTWNIGSSALGAIPIMLIELGMSILGFITRIWKKRTG